MEILEAEACPDYIHMLVNLPSNLRVSQFMGYLKGKSSLMIFERHTKLANMGIGISGVELTMSMQPERIPAQ